MSDAGYTLSEMLAALVMIGLTSAGLLEGMHVIGHVQTQASRAVGNSNALRSAQTGLERLLEDQGPFLAQEGARFAGSQEGFTFQCLPTQSCAASLKTADGRVTLVLSRGTETSATPLPPTVRHAEFAYLAGRGSAGEWPAASAGGQPLRAVSLTDDDGVALATVRLWAEQPRLCAFDPIGQVCRTAAP